jgi:hypothetical protein
MPTAKVQFNVKNGVQEGPGTDCSFITEMKRRRAIIVDSKTLPAGQQPVVDGQHTRGFTSGVLEYYATRGASLGFLSVK